MTLDVECDRRIAAAPETVYSFFTDPERYTRWQGTEADLDPRPGGVIRVNVTGEHIARGEFVELDPPKRIVFTWGWEGHPTVPPGSTTVEITLTPDGDGTLLRLRHASLPDEQEQAMHEQGWNHYLDRLVVAGAGGDPGPDAPTGA